MMLDLFSPSNGGLVTDAYRGEPQPTVESIPAGTLTGQAGGGATEVQTQDAPSSGRKGTAANPYELPKLTVEADTRPSPDVALEQAKDRVKTFGPGFLVMLGAISYLLLQA